MAFPEIDRNHPGYQRHCIGAGCKDSFHILDAMDAVGRSVREWRIAKSVVHGYLCPRHAAPFISGEHPPAWIREGDGPATGICCPCGAWSWSPDGPATQGEHQQRFMKHIEEQLEASRG